MRRNKNRLVSASLLALLGLSGCGASSSADIPAVAEPQKPAGGEVLTVVGADDTSEGGCFQAALNKYADEYGIEINYIEAPYGDAFGKIQQMIMSGDQPDLVRLSGIVDEGVADISTIINTEEYDKSLMDEGYQDGKPVAVPLNVTANGLVYNKELFEKAGITAPTFEDNWTWEEFSTNMEKLKASSGADYAWTMDFSEFRLATMLYTNDGQLYNDDEKKITINSPENVKMVEEMINQYNEGLAPKSVWLSGDDASALFESGKVGVYFAGNWKVQPYTESLGFDWGVMPVPEGTYGSSSNIGGNYLYPLADSENAAIASDFIQWLYADENYTEFLSQCSYLPAKTSTPTVEYDLNEVGQSAMETFREQTEQVNPKTVEDNVAKSRLQLGDPNFIRENISLAINGDMTAQEALDKAAQDTLDYISDKEEGWELAYPIEA